MNRRLRGSLTCPKVGTWDYLTSPPKEGEPRIFYTEKIQRLRPGSNPRTREPEAGTQTTEAVGHRQEQFDIFVNCNWVDTRWQWYSTHLHTNNTQNNTINIKTIRITNKTTQTTNLEECWPCPVFVRFSLAFVLQLRKNTRKTLSQGSRRDWTAVPSQPCHSSAAARCIVPKLYIQLNCSSGWAKTSAETCRADFKKINKRKLLHLVGYLHRRKT
jgi:hypothetical protein